MDMPANAFKRRIAAFEPVWGTWLQAASPTNAELLGAAGYDFMVVDMEHAPLDYMQVVEMLRTLAGTGASAVTRVPWNDAVLIKRALDAGAQTLLLPFVQDAGEAKAAVAATRYPPQGIRGVAGMTRASRYGAVDNYLARATDELCVIVQVETAAALAELPRILEVPGLDSVFVGPSDLAASMGHLGNPLHADVQRALEQAAKLCRAAGKPCGCLGGNPQNSLRYRDYGYSWMATGSDVLMLATRAREWLAEVKGPKP